MKSAIAFAKKACVNNKLLSKQPILCSIACFRCLKNLNGAQNDGMLHAFKISFFADILLFFLRFSGKFPRLDVRKSFINKNSAFFLNENQSITPPPLQLFGRY